MVNVADVPWPLAGETETAAGGCGEPAVHVPLFTHPVVTPLRFVASRYMFFGPVNANVRDIVTVTMLPLLEAEDAVTEH